MPMDIRPAKLVRRVSPSESWLDVVNEAKAETWTHRLEHALLKVDSGELLLVRGGADGLEFELGSERDVFVSVDDERRRVTLLAWHTHPKPTGPSDHDKAFLRELGQPSSMIYEMFGDGRGTVFYATDREVEP